MDLTEHARRELELCGQHAEDPEYSESIIKAVEAFASYGHSGGSVNGRIITWEERVPDPFVCAKVTVGFWDLLRSLWRGALVVKVHVDADADVVNDVMELDANTLTPNSTRRDEFNAGLFERLPACLSDDPETRRLDNLL